MYRDFFGLNEPPFSISPDPRYLYMSEGHREALAHLVYGISSDGGFVLLTGEVGTGKTTVCRCLLEQLPEKTNIAFILNPRLTVEELLATVCDDLGIRYPDGNTSIKIFVDRINAFLLDAHSKGHNTVVIIEEAQNLAPEVLEQVRLLTNLETNKRKLLQIIMLGQPELLKMLARPELRQLEQRITARYHLGPLSKEEVSIYVKHRLSVAGIDDKLFPDTTINRLFSLSGGIPRLINILCDRALLGAFVQGKYKVDKRTLSKAAGEVFGKRDILRQHIKTYRWLLAGLLLVSCGAALAATYYNLTSGPRTVKAPEPLRQEHKPVTLQWPGDRPYSGSRETAYQALFDQWHINYDLKAKSNACRQAQAQGLRCLHKQGSLSILGRLNRPAVLKMNDEKGREFFVTLKALQGQQAIFAIGDETRTLDIREIALQWSGDYTLFWRPPPEYRGELRRGDQGPSVQWLERQLAAIEGRPSQAGVNHIFDDALGRQAKGFQLSAGLVPDGVVGPETIIHLNNAAGSDEPLLTAGKGDN